MIHAASVQNAVSFKEALDAVRAPLDTTRKATEHLRGESLTLNAHENLKRLDAARRTLKDAQRRLEALVNRVDHLSDADLYRWLTEPDT